MPPAITFLIIYLLSAVTYYIAAIVLIRINPKEIGPNPEDTANAILGFSLFPVINTIISVVIIFCIIVTISGSTLTFLYRNTIYYNKKLFFYMCRIDNARQSQE